ncbi:MAG TPA: EAL domain-containing protein [Acetobacteraceae bacterium]|nr:EAL domain-containing protein [Acetobacteraceae bacterium]
MSNAALPDRPISRDRLAAFAFAAADLLVEIAPDSTITWAAGTFPLRFGEPAERFVGRKLESLIAPADHDALARTLVSASLRGHTPPVTLRLNDTATTPCALAVLNLPGPRRRLCVTLGPVPIEPPAPGASPQPAALFAQEVEARLRSPQPGGLGLLDIRGLPPETYTRGDARHSAVHEAVGKMLSSAADSGAVVGEVGEGRFGVLTREHLDTALLAATLQALLGPRPGAGEVAVDSRIIGLAPTDLSATQAVRAVRFALNKFAASGAAAVTESGFDGGLAGFIRRAQDNAAGLRETITERRFDLLFQPVVALRSQSVHHYEALLRPQSRAGALWQTPQEFVTCAEALGFAEELDMAVLEQVIRLLDRVQGCSIATNISGLSVQSEPARRQLRKLLPLGSYRRLLIELTETAEIQDIATAAATLEQFRAQRISVCLDDFGAGAAAFRYIRDLPVDYLKIDGAFVQGAGRGKRGRDLVRSMLELGRSVGAQAIAEGVETTAQARLMEELGCAYGQGWLFGKAAPLPELG